MKYIIKILFLILIISSCSSKGGESNVISETVDIEHNTNIDLLSDFPKIKDTVLFISKLKKKFEVQVDELNSPKIEKITYFKKVKIYGSKKEYYFLEYDYGDGCNAAYPWKLQFLISDKGNLVKMFDAKRFEFVKIFEHENPYLLILTVTARGNGGHEIYSIKNDSLENIYEGYYDCDVQTYDKNNDIAVFQPFELNIKFIDYNKDGFKDLIFSGKRYMLKIKTEKGYFDFIIINEKKINNEFTIENPAKIIPIEYVFLYNKETEHFVELEDNSEKYKLFE